MPKKSRAKNNTNSEKEFVLFPYGAEDEILPKPLKGSPTSRVALVRRLRRRAARLRIAYEFSISFVADHVGNARANSCLIRDFERLVSCAGAKKGAPKCSLALAQKTRFELVLPVKVLLP